MMASRDSSNAVAGGLARHIPVLGRRAVELLGVRAGGVYVDATFGAGGYSRAILAAADCQVVAIDRDRNAVAAGREFAAMTDGRLVIHEDRFSNLAATVRLCGHEAVDGVVFDLGVSSMQIDEAERGFSFRLDGPLDMRMGDAGPSAADVIAGASERDLAYIIATLGEEHHARAIARAVVRARAAAPIRTTRALANVVERVVHARPDRIHPATRTFQALRIFVNEELDELAAGLMAAESVLKPGGRLVAVSFHSLEDRIVKTYFAARAQRGGVSRHVPQAARRPPSLRIVTPRPMTPDSAEIAANPRARSAKLRAAERTDAPAETDLPARLVPLLPSLADATSGGRR